MPVGHSQSMSVRISTQTLFGRSNHMPQFCGGKTLRPNVIWRHAMTSFQATLTTEPPFSETPWRPGEYALRDAWFPVAHTPTLRSEEHTSELQSLMRISYAVFCLKKKKQTNM